MFVAQFFPCIQGARHNKKQLIHSAYQHEPTTVHRMTPDLRLAGGFLGNPGNPRRSASNQNVHKLRFLSSTDIQQHFKPTRHAELGLLTISCTFLVVGQPEIWEKDQFLRNTNHATHLTFPRLLCTTVATTPSFGCCTAETVHLPRSEMLAPP